MGQITAALSQQLVIEDIDESDKDNPQLCSEYVKEIYEYMRELEVESRFTEMLPYKETEYRVWASMWVGHRLTCLQEMHDCSSSNCIEHCSCFKFF